MINISRLVRPLAKRIESLPLGKRSVFEKIMDSIMFFRTIVDFHRLFRLRKSKVTAYGTISKNEGWGALKFDPSVTNRFIEIAHAVKNDYLNLKEKPINKKEYLQQIANIENISQKFPEVINFALDEALLKTIGQYLGKFPILHDVSVFYSPPQEKVKDINGWQGSQLFHRDGGGTRCFKLWLLCETVTNENGPTTLLPSKVSDIACKELNYVPGKKFKTDTPLEPFMSHSVSLVGPEGSWFATDTDRCLHYGSRTTKRSSRLVMMFHYVDRNSVYYLPFVRRNYLKRTRTISIPSSIVNPLPRAVVRFFKS